MDTACILDLLNEGRYENVQRYLTNAPTDIFEELYESLLKIAVDRNEIKTLHLLLERKPLNVKEFKFNPIIYSTCNENVSSEVLHHLVQANIWDINSTDRNGLTPLHMAAKHSYTKKLDILLQSKEIDINLVDHAGKNALHHLMESRCFGERSELKRLSLMLVGLGIDVNKQDNMNETVLHKVFQSYDEDIPHIFVFFLQNVKDINHILKDTQGLTLFHTMVSNIDESLETQENFKSIIEGRDELIQNYIRGKFVDISPEILKRILNEPDSRGSSAFQTYIDSKYFSLETIKCLIDAGASINTSTNIGITPLMQAVLRERDDVVDLLIGSGADANKTDIFGQTAIFRARTEKSFESLCESGAQLNVKDKFGRCPLANRVIYTPLGLPSFGMTLKPDLGMNIPLAIRFLERGIDINSTDRYESTLLHYAAWHSDMNMLEILLKYGSRKDIIDRHGYTPYDLAVHHGNFETYPMLKTEREQVFNMLQSDEQNFHERCSSYVRFIIHHRETDDMRNVLKLTGADDIDPNDLIGNMMLSPRIGFTDRLSESGKIQDDVNQLLNRIANKISELDVRFRCSVFPTGSSAEGTQIGDPVEKDFVLCLSYFEDQCQVIQTDDNFKTGFAQLELKNYSKYHDLVMFVDQNNKLRTDLIRQHFQDLVIDALNTKEIWSSEHLYFDGLLCFPEDKPILNVNIEWFGAIAKAVSVSIDIVPAIHKPSFTPKDIDETEMRSLARNTEAGFFLLFHPPEHSTKHFDSVRISSAPSEIQLLKSVPEIFRESYTLSKILKSGLFCLVVQFSDTESSTEDEYTMDSPNSSEEKHDEDELLKEEHSRVKSNRMTVGILPADMPSVKIIETFETEIAVEPTSDSLPKTENNITDCASGIQKVPGWILSLDENQVIRKMYIPKEHNVKPLQKWICAMTKKEDSDFVEIEEAECHRPEVDKKKKKSDISQNKSVDESRHHAKETQNKDETCQSMQGNIQDDKCSASIISSQDSFSDLENEFEGGDIVLAKDEISSYMLKNCLFYVMENMKKDIDRNSSHLQITKKIYETLMKSAQEKKLPAFFLPYIDIFSYVNTHIRMVQEKKAERELTKHCARIETFCKVILGILSQNDNR